MIAFNIDQQINHIWRNKLIGSVILHYEYRNYSSIK